MAEIKQLTVYHDDDSLEQFGRVKAYYVKKNAGRPVSDSWVGRELIREKDADITNERTRSLTLAKVYAELQAMGWVNEERYRGLILKLDQIAKALEKVQDPDYDHA